MDIVHKQDLIDLIQKADEHSISIFIPTHKTGNDAQQDPIRLKNALSEVRKKLENRGLREPDINDMLEPVEQKLTDDDFWLYQNEGLSIFVTENESLFYRVPISFKEQVYVDDQFYISPMVPLITGDGQFFVLALSQNDIRLLQCTKDHVEEVELDDIPSNIDEFRKFDVHEKHLQSHSGPDGASTFQGYGDASEDEKKYVEEFLKHVESGVTSYMKKQQDPLILTGVHTVTAMYAKVNHYHELMDESVKGNPEEFSADELNDKAWSVMEPYFTKELENELERYSNLSGSQKRSNNLEEVVKAAKYGRVDTLFISSGNQQWGKYDEQNDTLHLNGSQEDGFHDVYNQAAIETLSNSGKVYALDQNQMPEGANIAAIFRYE